VAGSESPCASEQSFIRNPSPSGRYDYKSWAMNAKGERVARKCSSKDARLSADLVYNSYRNANGCETVFGLVFDLDAHRAKDCWKDANGRLDWSLIFPALQKEIPEVASLICYAVRSTGGKGLGVVMAITPLPIVVSTAANQKSALKLQGRLLTVFDRLGFGADFGARGVSRDLPNFNNPVKLVYRNTEPLRALERSGRPVVTELHRVLNARDRAARISERIYNDERVEKGLARLVLWLLGAMSFDKAWSFEGKDYSRKFKKVPYLSGWTISASMRELCTLTGLSDAFLRKYLKNPPKWLKAAHYDGEGWNLNIPLSKDVPWLQERSLHLLQKTEDLKEKVDFDPNELCLPWWVQDGERNLWIVRLALMYKWAGYSLDCAIEKVLLRVNAIPNAECSRNCRSVRSIVKSLYRRLPEHFGLGAVKQLPNWIRDDRIFCTFFSRTNTRRGETPCPVLDSSSVELKMSEFEMSPTKLRTFSQQKDKKDDFLFIMSGSNAEPLVKVFDSSWDVQSVQKVKRLIAIRHRQRVGIFDGDSLVLCLTRRHYQASLVLERLSMRPEYSTFELKLYTPHLKKQTSFFAAINNVHRAVPADGFCGRRATRGEKITDWREEKGMTYVGMKSNLNLFDDQIPF
jgi:hypothetical protein